MEPLDFVAIGDITTDAFIKIKDAKVTCDVDHHNCKISLRFGDKVPYESVEIVKAVGNSANAAVSAARLGLRSALIADVGADENGKEAITALIENKVASDFVRTHEGMQTNYHYVLWYEEERTILVKHQAYPYKMPENLHVRWVYFSSVGEDSIAYHEEIARWLLAHPETKFAFQPGTFQIKLGAEKLKKLYQRTDVFICNLEESQQITGSTSTDPKILLAGMRALGPKTAIITDGPRGAYAADGLQTLFMPQYPDQKPPFERTGAGDAFASTLVSFLALGLTLQDALLRAPINSMSVVQQVGAQKGLLDRATLEEWLTKAPAEYAIKNLS